MVPFLIAGHICYYSREPIKPSHIKLMKLRSNDILCSYMYKIY